MIFDSFTIFHMLDDVDNAAFYIIYLKYHSFKSGFSASGHCKVAINGELVRL